MSERDKNELKIKCLAYEQTIRELKDKVFQLETKLQERSNLLTKPLEIYTESVNNVILGHFKTNARNLRMDGKGLILKCVDVRAENESAKDVLIPFEEMVGLQYCSHLSSTALIVDINSNLMSHIHEILGSYDIESDHSSQRMTRSASKKQTAAKPYSSGFDGNVHLR